MHSRAGRKSGFTLTEMMVTVAVVALLAAIAIPSLIKSRNTASRNSCIVNLKTIDGATQQWAMEKKKNSSSAVTITDLQPYLKDAIVPACPAEGIYSVTRVGALPLCSQSAAGHSL
jgi:prepilin-type N-terminal cleavage/methylation domain-containing protein